ncbi:MAG: PH domain-containing protein [Promethearchaeota archaeon]
MENKEIKVNRIEKSYITSQMIGSFFVSLFIGLGIYGIGWLIVLIMKDEGETPPILLWPIIYWIIIGIAIISLTLTYIFDTMYYKNFSYEISEKFITIHYGRLTRTKTTIPFSRIQNIAIYQNIRDRWLNIYTVKIETAGSSAAVSSSQKGMVRPEGYIPAIKDPKQLENMINRMVHRYTQDIPKVVQDKVFMDSNVAFDEFIAYFIAKMREKDQLKTGVKKLRENSNWSQEELAEKLGVSRTTVKYLEAGEYVPSLTLALRISHIFNVSIEDVFELE